MDKLKLRNKRKRNNEKKQAAIREDRMLRIECNRHFKGLGLKHQFSTDSIRKAYREIHSEATHKAIYVLAIQTLWVMHKECGYASQRLFRLAADCTALVALVNKGNGTEQLARMKQELIDDTGIDIDIYWDEFKIEMPGGLAADERERRQLLIKTLPVLFPIYAHAVFYMLYDHGLSRKSNKLDRLFRRIAESSIWVVTHDSIDNTRQDLARHGFIIDRRGRFGGEKVRPESYNEAVNRLERIINAK